MWNTIFILLAIWSCVYALTEDEVKAELTKLVIKCNKGKVDMAELLQLQLLIPPSKPEVKCILACAYKEQGSMTQDGLFSIDYAYKLADQLRKGDESKAANLKKLADICVKVNDVQVTDGTKGCERAALMYKCTLDNALKFGYKL